MNECKKLQQMIVPFEKNMLSLKQEEIFISHLEKCEDCREELEIYYIIDYGLDENEHIDKSDPRYIDLIDAFDFKGLIELKIENSKIKIQKMHRHNKNVWLSFSITNVSMALTMLVLYIIINF